MKTELGYVYDSTSNQREQAGSYETDTTRPGIHDYFPIIHNPSPLVVVDGVPTSVEALDSVDITIVDTIQVLPAGSGYASAIYGSRGAQKGVIVVTTKEQ